MKTVVLLALVTLFGSALWADDESGFCAPCKFVALGTNTSYKVACQVRYENLLDEKLLDEIALNRNDKVVNVGLEKFLTELCNDMEDFERVSYFSNGDIQACTNLDFGPWLAEYIEKINAKYGSTVVDVKIYDVRMKPTGEFADAVAAEE